MTGGTGDSRGTDPHRFLLRGAALAAAFSPVFLGLFDSLAEDVGHRHVLLPFLLMISLLVLGVPAGGPAISRRTGIGLIALGIALELVGLATTTSLIARIGLPLAVLGFSGLFGRPDLRIALLAFGLVPIPDSVKSVASPDLESLIALAAVRVWSGFGVALEAAGPLLRSGGGRLELAPGDSGLVTAVLLAEYGWYSAARKGGDLGACLATAVRWAVAGVVVQPVLVLASTGILALGWPGLGRFGLSHGVSIGLAVLVIRIHFVRLGTAGRATQVAVPVIRNLR